MFQLNLSHETPVFEGSVKCTRTDGGGLVLVVLRKGRVAGRRRIPKCITESEN